MSNIQVGDLIPIGAVGTAKQSDVLEGKTYSSDEGVDLKGTMPVISPGTKILTNQGDEYRIPEGFHHGTGIVRTNMFNLVPENIKKGVNVGGIMGILDPKPEFLLKEEEISINMDKSSTGYIEDIPTETTLIWFHGDFRLMSASAMTGWFIYLNDVSIKSFSTRGKFVDIFIMRPNIKYNGKTSDAFAVFYDDETISGASKGVIKDEDFSRLSIEPRCDTNVSYATFRMQGTIRYLKI